jgi:hypothetical protein
MDKPEVVTAKGHDMVAVVGLSEADEFADLSLADEGELAPPLDFAARAHPSHLMVGVVPPGLGVAPAWPRRGRVEIGRRPLGDRFMRPLLVVVAAERVEARLLLPGVGGRSPRGPLFDGVDEMRLDAKLEPTRPKAASSRLPASRTGRHCRSGSRAADRKSGRRASKPPARHQPSAR